jgi:hypothetical protein
MRQGSAMARTEIDSRNYVPEDLAATDTLQGAFVGESVKRIASH